jgi:hypothetical protein
MWRTAASLWMASLFLTGCFASYRSVSGRLYGADGTDAGALEQALRDSGSTNLKCAPSQVRVRTFVTGTHYAADTFLVAEGCGQRAFYAADCSAFADVTSAALARCPGNTTGLPPFGGCHDTAVTAAERACELVLVSKVKLE